MRNDPVARPPIAVIFLLTLLGASIAGWAQDSSGFLLRQRFRLVQADEQVDLTVERVIFRDGLIVTTSISPDQTYFRRRRASPEALRNLHSAFRRHRIGRQSGECLDGSTSLDIYSQTVTYFTGGPAGHTFRTGNAFAEPCGVGLTLLLSEISDFANTAPAELGLQEVLVPN